MRLDGSARRERGSAGRRGGGDSPYLKPTREASDRMRRIRSHGTGLERRMEELLGELGLGFVLQPDLPDHPDFLIEGTRVLIFCDSSFWHGRRDRERSGRAFARNRVFWRAKLQRNRARDQRVSHRLRRAGWSVLRFWDDAILKTPDAVKRKLERRVRAAR